MMTRQLAPLGALLAAVAGPAFGQLRELPQGYMWQPSCYFNGTSCVPVNGKFVPMSHADVATVLYNQTTPAQAAAVVAQEIHNGLVSGHITADRVCIILRGFGHDGKYSETTSGEHATNQDTRFFREVDRLPDLADGSFPVPPPNDFWTARTYRHPFLSNATTGGKLAEWMQGFVDEFNAIRANPTHPANVDPPLPDPSVDHFKFYMDCEPYLAFTYGHANPVRMLRWLYEYGQTPGHPDIWNTWKVPGSPGWMPPQESDLVNPGTLNGFASTGGMTMAEMYQAVLDAQDFSFGDPLWPVHITDPGGIVSPNPPNVVRADNPANRTFMQWYYEIALAAELAVVKTSCYDVLKANWPGVIVSNYDEARYDGVIDTTGWFADHDQAGAANNWLPRGDISREWAPTEAFFDRLSIRALDDSRWLNLKHTTSADRDSPNLYPLGFNNLAGYPPGFVGHAAPNLYLPTTVDCYSCNSAYYDEDPCPNPAVACVEGHLVDSGLDTEHVECCEPACGDCGMDTSLRLARHSVESIINSVIPGEPGTHEARLSPWVGELAGYASGNPIDLNNGEERYVRDLLAMLRAKNVQEIQWWVPGDSAYRYNSWLHTISVTNRVYAAEVVDMKTVYGEDPENYAGHDVSMLEYTLRDANGDPVEAVVVPTMYFEAGPPAYAWMQSGIDVFVDIKTNDHLGTPIDFTQASWGFDVHVESRAGTGAVMQLLAYDPNAGFTQLPLRKDGYDHSFTSSDGSARRTFVRDSAAFRFVTRDEIDPNLFHMRLRIIHTGLPDFENPPFWATSTFDLVQVVPFFPPVPGSAMGFVPPPSDFNYNGEVDEKDLSMFLSGWVNGAAGADLNLNDEVDGFDLEAFVSSYNQQAP